MLKASTFLREAEKIFDSSNSLRAEAESKAWRSFFQSGAVWMHQAMSELRGARQEQVHVSFAWLGFAKYLLASLSAILILALAWWWHPILIILVVPAFYSVEVQWVFLFPAALDGSHRPWADSRELMQRHAGTLSALSFVLPFAWRMLTGGFCGRGFVRSWCTGCLAVVLWYEQCRQASATTDDASKVTALDIGQRASLFIRMEKVSMPVRAKARVLFISDLHLRTATVARLLNAVQCAISQTVPDVVVLGGDFADTHAGLIKMEKCVNEWSKKFPVIAIPGNHDRLPFCSNVREVMLNGGVHWLPDSDYIFQSDGQGALRFSACKHDHVVTSDLPLIAVLHDPASFPQAHAKKATLALAGHLHGCQIVLSQRKGRLLPGAWFYKWNVLRMMSDGCTLIVSRGCADTLPLRWNCPREVVCCDLVPEYP